MASTFGDAPKNVTGGSEGIIPPKQTPANTFGDAPGKESSDTTGILGAVLGGLVGIGVAAATSISGPGAIVAGMAAAGLGSFAGNIIEEMTLDWFFGRDPAVSPEEFVRMLDEVGIDMLPVPGGKFVFKFGGKAIGGTLGKVLQWAGSILLSGGKGFAVDVLGQMAKAGKESIKSVVKKGTQDVSVFLTEAGLGEEWLKALSKGGHATILKTQYRNIWVKAYHKAAADIVRNPDIFKTDIPAKALVEEINTAAELMARGGYEEKVAKLTAEWTDEVINLIITHANGPITKWVNKVADKYSLHIPSTLLGAVGEQGVANITPLDETVDKSASAIGFSLGGFVKKPKTLVASANMKAKVMTSNQPINPLEGHNNNLIGV